MSLSTASAHPSCNAELDSGRLLRDSDDPRVRRYASAFADVMEMRASSGGNYLSLTCTVIATSKPQLDALYTDLTAHPLVKVVL